MKLKNQHFVTASYIRAWTDPSTPDGAYVWVIDKKNQESRMKSPKNLFVEPDFYTVYDSAGNRILELEESLSRIESDFMSMRRNKLERQEPLTPNDRQIIALFVSTMFARTNFQKQDQKEMWQSLLDKIETWPAEISEQIKQTSNYEVVRQLHIQPMPFHMFHFVNLVAPYLISMNCAIFETDTTPGFITSDHPCVWFDPAVYDPEAPVSFFGVGSPTLDIILPVSPSQLISLKPNGPDGYFSFEDNVQAVDQLNRLIVMNSDEFIVLNRESPRPYWFEEG